MKHKLIPLYREKEAYTLFYEPEGNHLYKFQHRNKSFVLFFMFILLAIYGSKFLDNIYQQYQTMNLNVILYIIALCVTFFISQKFYQTYYIPETKRKIILDEKNLEKCAVKGTKQFRIEFYSAIASLPVGIIFSVIFFLTGMFRPLVISCLFVSVIFILAFMRPMDRKKILKGFRERSIVIE